MLSDESDDTVSDDILYESFVTLLAKIECTDPDIVEKTAKQVTKNYSQEIKGATEPLTNVLSIMYFAYRAALLRNESEARLNTYIKNK